MKATFAATVCFAATLAIAGAALAQGTGQQPPQSQTPPSTGMQAEQQIVVTGCVVRESDYRKARDAGKGGVAGTGVGAGDEFVLTQATSSASKDPARAGEPEAPTGTSATTMSYELSGPSEGQLTQYVGRRVEITGRLKPAQTDASGRPTGGATAGQPPAGVDVTSKDLKLRELEVASVREATGTCNPIK